MLKITACVGGRIARILIDGGCTGNIMSPAFAAKAGVPLLEQEGELEVRLGDGSTQRHPRVKTLHSVRVFIPTETVGSPHIEQLRFRVAPIGYDIILGKQWLERHNPQINWRTNEVTIGPHTI